MRCKPSALTKKAEDFFNREGIDIVVGRLYWHSTE